MCVTNYNSKHTVAWPLYAGAFAVCVPIALPAPASNGQATVCLLSKDLQKYKV